MTRIDAEIDNVRAAMSWLMDIGDGLRALRLVVAFDDYWSARRYRAESRPWSEFGLAAAPDAPPALRATALRIAVFSSRAVGDFPAAIALAEHGLRVAHAAGDSIAIGRAYYQLGNAWHHVDVERALVASTEAVAVFRLADHAGWLAVTLADLGDKLHIHGDPAAAGPLIDEGIEINWKIGHAWGIAQALGKRAHVARSQGNPALAARLFIELIPLAQEIGDEHMVMGAVAGLAGVAVDLAQPERAARLLGAVAAEQERTGWPRVAHPLNVDRIVAAVRATLDEEEYAKAFAAGRATTFDTAVADAKAIGQVDGNAQAKGVPIRTEQHRLAADAHLPLTQREQVVLAQLCQRRTNAEIAAALFLSPRTIETHVAHVIQKLGATNRREAAARAARRGLVEGHVLPE